MLVYWFVKRDVPLFSRAASRRRSRRAVTADVYERDDIGQFFDWHSIDDVQKRANVRKATLPSN